MYTDPTHVWMLIAKMIPSFSYQVQFFLQSDFAFIALMYTS